MIVFGWRSLKIRSFTLSDVGLIKQVEPGTEFEVRQAYFHLFWIPMFGLGKRWVVRRGSNLYEMPGEIKALGQKSLKGIGTPWYTFTGPILLFAASFIFSGMRSYENAESERRAAKRYREEQAELTAKLQHLTTNDFITVETKSHPSGHVMFLKVEDVKGDDIMVTPVESDRDEPMIIDKAYKRYASTMPSIKVSHKKLLAAFPKERDSLLWGAAERQSANLLNDDTRYTVKNVVRHFRPIVKVSHVSTYENSVSIYCTNAGWSATITGMKNLVGNIDWSKVIDKEFPCDEENEDSYITLKAKNTGYHQPYKFIMTLKDSAGHEYNYEMESEGDKRVTVRDL